MAVKRFKESSVLVDKRYQSMLAGNDYYVPPSFESIATATSNGTETSITLSSIPSTYKHLQVRIIGRNSIAASDASFAQMQVNGDSSTSYSQHELWGGGSSVTSSGGSGYNSMQYGTIVRNSATSGIFGVSIIDVPDYASTTKNKTFRILTGNDRNGAGILALFSGLWESTSAINSLTFYPNNPGQSYTFISGTQIALYGIKG